jgi:hypothetical protein
MQEVSYVFRALEEPDVEALMRIAWEAGIRAHSQRAKGELRCA